MIRLASIGGMTGGFLMISPGLRGNVIKGYSMIMDILNDASPWSYLGIGILIFVLLTMELYRHAIPKHKKVTKY